ncbi:ankyrin [Aspergillus heteromorphus CBS 117.55]|uniref:Ankyrin n=1 Tax=Aspergillus heteromorphus CBS 117.55 TaxID=1448321 RepID=A0A317V4V4_9EURO|nr:ankyrin [Aspergillus heteromorphus CBS 117.55]PWY67887.1 ankyrin [Aspergillus heteromorphus CBS 117.55]
MPLANLPPELILQISGFLGHKDLNSLAQTSRVNYQLLNPSLYRSILRSDQSRALDRAIYRGHVSTLKRLIEYGANVPPIYSRESRIIMAGRRGHVAMVAFLIDREGPGGVEKYFLYDIAVRTGNVPMLQILVERGLRVVNPDWSLIAAAKRGHLRMLEYLVSQHRDFNRSYTIMHGALYWGICRRRVAVVKFLLSKGVSPNGKPSQRKCEPLLNIAVARGTLEIVRLLLDHGARPFKEETLLLVGENLSQPIEIARLLLARFPELKSQLPGLLVKAARHRSGYSSLVSFVLSQGVDPNYATPGERKVLSIAVVLGNVGCVRALLGAGANPLLPDMDGATTLDLAKERPYRKNHVILGLILEVSRRVAGSG